VVLLNLFLPGSGYFYVERVDLGIMYIALLLLVGYTIGFWAVFVFWMIPLIDGLFQVDKYNRNLARKISNA
jgi:TM2 domain-containing membrane protein YozV